MGSEDMLVQIQRVLDDTGVAAVWISSHFSLAAPGNTVISVPITGHLSEDRMRASAGVVLAPILEMPALESCTEASRHVGVQKRGWIRAVLVSENQRYC